MARGTTTRLALSVYDQRDKPGAGSKTVKAGNTGLNGNWLIIDDAVGVGHNADGTHKTDAIDGPNLKTTAVDNATLQLTGAPLKLSVKDSGIGSTQLAGGSVTAAKMAAGAVGASTTLAADVVITSKILDSNVTTPKIADDAVTSPKISHDNTRTKHSIVMGLNSDVDGTYALISGIQSTVSLGVPMSRPGSITRMEVCSSSGNVGAVSGSYGAYPFSAGDRLTAYMNASAAKTVQIYKNGAYFTGLTLELGGTKWIVTVEVEFDD